MLSLVTFALAKLHFLSPLQSFMIGLVVALLVWMWVSAAKNASIPGPFSVPLLGSVFVLCQMLSNEKRHKVRVDLAKKYGSIFALQLGSGQFVFLNDIHVIKEAFITKGEIISDRVQESPSHPLVAMFGYGKGIGSANYGKEFKESREKRRKLEKQ